MATHHSFNFHPQKQTTKNISKSKKLQIQSIVRKKLNLKLLQFDQTRIYSLLGKNV